MSARLVGEAASLIRERGGATVGGAAATDALRDGSRDAPQRARASTARTLADWLDEPDLLSPPAATIPHLVVKGRVTLLSGREKIGKSTLVASAVAAVSCGQNVLGVPIERPLQTIWYNIDEPIGDTVLRFGRLGADAGRIAINREPRLESELLAALEVDLASFEGVDLVVVDTLSRVLAASGVDPNSSTSPSTMCRRACP